MHQISVWFVCKLCRSSYQQVPDLIKHKFENHFEQFKSVKHIVFEESVYDADFDYPDDEDHYTKSKPFDEGQVDWDPCVNTIQKQPFSLNKISYFKPEDPVFEDKKPFTYSSANSEPLDTINSRSANFTIQQDSVIINGGTLNDLGSAAPNLHELTRPQPQHHVDEGNKVSNAARIKNPFVLLRRLSPTEIESAKSNSEHSQLFQSNFDFATDTTYPIYSKFDQRSINSDNNARPSSDCEIDADLDVKPFKLNEESHTLSEKNQFTCPRQNCNNVFQQENCLTTHFHGFSDLKRRRVLASSPNSPTHGINDHQVDCNDTSSVTLFKTKTSETFDCDKNEHSRKYDTVTHDVLPESLGHNEVDSTIEKQPQFTCPHGKCKLIFRNITCLSLHVNYYHGQDDLERRRRLIASAIPQSGRNDDKEVDVRDIPESPLAHWIKKEVETCNRNGNPNVIRLDPDPTTINRNALPISQKNPIKCKLCSKKLISEASVKCHVSTCWFNNKQKHRYCVPCGFTFGTPDRLKRHNVSKHLSVEEKLARAKYMCDHCPKLFYQESEFTTHVCEIGGFTCTSMGILDTHVATTYSDRKITFKCPYTHCGMALKSRKGREIHLRVVHSE